MSPGPTARVAWAGRGATLALALAVVASGCRADSPGSVVAPGELVTAVTPPEAPADAAPELAPDQRALRDPARFACAADADCVNSCALGAVNAAWYATLEPLGFVECEDGCADVLAAPPRCEERTCVAYRDGPRTEDGTARRDECTRRRPAP